jgi:hypothetical protein
VADAVAVHVRLDLLAVVLLVGRLDRPGEHQPRAGRPRGLDRPVRALDRREAAEPEQVVVLLRPERPLVDVDRVRHDRLDVDAVGRGVPLRLADRDQVRLAAVADVERGSCPR